MFEAEDTMYPVTPIDSLTYKTDIEEQEDPEHPGRYFEVLIYTHEPQETKDYYRFNFYRNDSAFDLFWVNCLVFQAEN